jgi:hypothetical protein
MNISGGAISSPCEAPFLCYAYSILEGDTIVHASSVKRHIVLGGAAVQIPPIAQAGASPPPSITDTRLGDATGQGKCSGQIRGPFRVTPPRDWRGRRLNAPS